MASADASVVCSMPGCSEGWQSGTACDLPVPQLQSGGNAAQHIVRQRRQAIHVAAAISKAPIGEEQIPCG